MYLYTGKGVSYPSFVDKFNIKSTGANGYRFSLDIPFSNLNEKENVLVVILKNPSSATKTLCDLTISKVCNVAYNNGYNKVIILNLFPIRATKANQVLVFYQNKNYHAIMKRNLQIIQQKTNHYDTVFAWGTDTIGHRKQYKGFYDTAIKDVVTSVVTRTFYVKKCVCNRYKCSKKQFVVHNFVRYPAHGLTWMNTSTLVSY